MERPLYQTIAIAIGAHDRCVVNGNAEWRERWYQLLDTIERDYLPRGSGFDAGCTIDRDRSNEERIVILAPFHPMDEYGSYAGWEDYVVVVRPAFDGISLRVTKGRDRNGVKEYVMDTLYHVLVEEGPPVR